MNIELIKNFYSALNQNDIQAVMKMLHPDIERKEFIGTPNAGTFRGLFELEKHILEARSTWFEGSCSPQHFEISDNKVLVSVYVKVKVKETMSWVEGNVYDGFAVQNEKIIYFETFPEKSQALQWLKQPLIESARVKLRYPVPGDIALLRDLDSDPEVMKHLTGGRPSTEEELTATINRILELSEKYQEKFGVWLAFDKSTDEFIGWFLFRPDKKNPGDHQNPELGYRLKKKFWGQGIASEVSQVIIDRAFTKYDFKSIFAITLKANLGSQGVMKKIGMKWVKDYVEDQFPGEDKEAVRYAITKEEWLNKDGR